MEFPRKVFMPFLVLGDPDYETSVKLVKALIDNGAGALELGFAFSDPIADGPTIQKADKRALDYGINTEKAFLILEKIRSYSSIPLSLMLSFNIIYNYGLEEFYRRCSNLKINGILCPDIPLEESEDVVKYARKYGINQVFIISPTTSDARMKQISEVCTGYVYLVSLLGTTGARTNLNTQLEELISRAKKIFKIPVYVGFGISKPEHVKKVIALGADGAISGSAVCKIIEENLSDPSKMEMKMAEFCRSMSKYD